MARVLNWRIDLMRAHPGLFETTTDETEYASGFPLFEEGWRDVLERLCLRTEDALREHETFQWVRIKQKFGIGRFDWVGEVSDETRLRIVRSVDLAVARSACTCEICGSVGHLYSSRGWLATRCADHAAGDPVPVEAGRENVRRYRRTPGKPDMFYAHYDRETDTLTEVPRPAPRSEE
jgi:hypothetical protein